MNRILESARRDWTAWLILFLGAALRWWQLSDFPFHPDEAIHAWFALDLRDYHYDPVYHGPLLYHLVASAFAIFGVHDFSARIIPAVCGVLLLWLVLFPCRKYLGPRGALWSGVLLALSPVIVAYSRRLLHDSLVLALTLSAVLCFQTALDHPSTSRKGRLARVGLTAVLTLFLATKANVFFIAAMLAVFYIRHIVAQKKYTVAAIDFVTPALCFGSAFAIFVLLFRSDSLSALPKMIGYWGGQQSEPRLPGPHDYYFRLLLLYELPLFLSAIWGIWCAFRKRTPFTDLVLWWSFTSLALYAVANEKVPWLMAHQVLPLALLAGYGLAQIEWSTATRRVVFALAVSTAVLFSMRHILATNWEEPANRHEPLFFAQTSESYRDTLFASLQNTRALKARSVWAAPEEQWPAAWYLRDKTPHLQGSKVLWNDTAPDEKSLRLVIVAPEEWEKLLQDGKFSGWNYVVVERYVWPRPSWNALAPKTFWLFWTRREASRDNGVLEEESSAYSIFATPPDANTDKHFSSIR